MKTFLLFIAIFAQLVFALAADIILHPIRFYRDITSKPDNDCAE